MVYSILTNLASTVNYGAPNGYTFLDWYLENFFVLIWPYLGQLLGQVVYVIVRFMLNIVDFLQFFCQKLVGIDYWMKGNVSAETLGDSDIIFRFLFSDPVQRVLRLMTGVFAVLLIVFTIVAIIKSEYEYVTNNDVDKASNSKTGIFRTALKSIFLVIIMPILLIMGILASNAILSSLVNAFNLDNRQTLGSQIFTVSAYEGNRYRLYADSNQRQGISNYVNVTYEEDGQTKTHKIKAAFTPINPMLYTQRTPFICVEYRGKRYLYDLSSDPSGGEAAVNKYYKAYETYFEGLGAQIVTPTSVGKYSIGLTRAFYAVINDCHSGDPLVGPAYNTWDYNELFTRTDEWDKTIEKVSASSSYMGDSGKMFPQAFYYYNNKVWSNYHDGGKNGLVTIADEYYVLADLLDYMVSDTIPVSFVNINNPRINWTYPGADGEGYLSDDFIHTENGNVDKFLVYYANSEPRVYQPNLNATKEEDGAIFIAAYYDEANNTYVPVVNKKTYNDGTVSARFETDYLADNYYGLIVARGILRNRYSNTTIGYPSQLETVYGNTRVSTLDPEYLQLDYNQKQVWLERYYDINFGFNDAFAGIEKSQNKYWLEKQYVGELDRLVDGDTNNTALTYLGGTLPTDMSVRAYDTDGFGNTTNLHDISWEYCDYTVPATLFDSAGSGKYYVFMSDKKIKTYVDNSDFNNAADYSTGPSGEHLDDEQIKQNRLELSENTIREVPLYAFAKVGYDGSNLCVDIFYVYSEYSGADQNWFKDSNGKTGIYKVIDDCIFGGYSVQKSFGSGNDITRQHSDDGLKGRILNYQIDLAIPTEWTSKDVDDKQYEIPNSRCVAYLSANYPMNMENLEDTGGCLHDLVTSNKRGSNADHYITSSHGLVLEFLPTITGDIITNQGTLNGAGLGGSGYSFKELSRTADENGDIVINFMLYNGNSQYTLPNTNYGVLVKLSYKAATGEVSLLPCDYYKMYLGSVGSNGNITSSSTIKSGRNDLLVRITDMTYLDSKVSDTGVVVQRYRYDYSLTQGYVFNVYEAKNTNGVSDYGDNRLKTDYYDVTFNFYNAFTFKISNSNSIQYLDPDDQSKVLSDGNSLVQSYNFLISEDDIEFERRASTDAYGNRIYTVNLYLSNGEKLSSENMLVTFNYLLENGKDTTVTTDTKLDALKNGYNFNVFSLGGLPTDTYSSIPIYKDNNEAKNALGVKQQVIFFLDRVTQGSFRFDIHFDFWAFDLRIKLGFFSGASASTREYLLVSFTGGQMKINYNFNALQAMDVNTFYSTNKIQYLILVFATILVMSVLGKAVWGLIQRIYNITLYFLVMPGVAATMPIDKGTRFDNWKKKLVPEVLGGYGTLIGINFFFILMPVIRSASKIFTEADIKSTLAQGNWIRLVPVAWLNELVYILFLLVAFTLIKTLPGVIADLVGSGKADALANADNVRKNVAGTISSVGNAVSGRDAVKAFEWAKGTAKSFIPGKAIYDHFKGGDSDKKGGKKHDEGSNAADENSEVRNNIPTGNGPGGPGGGTPQTTDATTEANATQETANGVVENIGDQVEETIENIANTDTGEAADASSENAIPPIVIPRFGRTQDEQELANLRRGRDENLTRWANGKGPRRALSAEEQTIANEEYNAKQENNYQKIFDPGDEGIRKAAFEFAGLDANTATADQANEAMMAYRAEMARQAWNANNPDNYLASERELRDAYMNSRQARMDEIQATAKSEGRSLTKPERDEYERLKNELGAEVDSYAYNRREALREKERNKLTGGDLKRYNELNRRIKQKKALTGAEQSEFDALKERYFTSQDQAELNDLNKRNLVASFMDQRIKELSGKEKAGIIKKSEMEELTRLRNNDDLTDKAMDIYNKEIGGKMKTAAVEHINKDFEEKIAEKENKIRADREQKRREEEEKAQKRRRKSSEANRNEEAQKEDKPKPESKREIRRKAELEKAIADQLQNSHKMGSVQAELGQLTRDRTALQHQLAKAYENGDVKLAEDLNGKIDGYNKEIANRRTSLETYKAADKAFEKTIKRLQGQSYATSAAERIKNKHLEQINGQIQNAEKMLAGTSQKTQAYSDLSRLLESLKKSKDTIIAQDANARYAPWSGQTKNAKYGVMTMKQAGKNATAQIGSTAGRVQAAVNVSAGQTARTDSQELQGSYTVRAGSVKDSVAERRIANAVRNTFRKDIADMLSRGDGRKYGINPPKSAGKALEAAHLYREALNKTIDQLQKKIEQEGIKASNRSKQELEKLKAKVQEISRIAEKAKKAADKQKKNVDDLMRDKRSNKYQLTKLLSKIDDKK